MDTTKAEFKASYGLSSQLPERDRAEIVFSGRSNVGKSSLINRLQTGISMETGEISTKIERGKHTTRHSELIYVSEDTYIVDTPGFSSIELYGMEKEELQDYFPEFADWEPECRFTGCAHVKERDCGVKTALERGEISRSRYENYCQLYEELKNKVRPLPVQYRAGDCTHNTRCYPYF